MIRTQSTTVPFRPTAVHFVVATWLAGAAAACNSGFVGSNVQIDFGAAIPAQDRPGVPLVAGRVPADAHFALYAIKEVRDQAGALVSSAAFEVQRFEILPALDLTSPCLIEADTRSPYHGIHLFQIANRIANDTGIDDIANPPPAVPESEIILLSTSRERISRARSIGGTTGIKAITSASSAKYPAIGTKCSDTAGFDATLIPPPNCADDESNRVRLAQCEAFWKDNPDYYEGRDSILTAPVGGKIDGVVVGRNPTNQSAIGGSNFFVDEALTGAVAYAVYWQYDNITDPSDLGTLYMYGRTSQPTRGVTKVKLVSPLNSTINATMAIFENLGEDNVHF
jgi:hypothetical protein